MGVYRTMIIMLFNGSEQLSFRERVYGLL